MYDTIGISVNNNLRLMLSDYMLPLANKRIISILI